MLSIQLNFSTLTNSLLSLQEAFSLCDSKLIEVTRIVKNILHFVSIRMLKLCLQLIRVLQKVDNVPMLQLDIVWCYFVLRDVSCLEVAGTRLEKARVGFERSHGKDSSRFRVLQAGRQADLAM